MGRSGEETAPGVRRGHPGVRRDSKECEVARLHRRGNDDWIRATPHGG